MFKRIPHARFVTNVCVVAVAMLAGQQAAFSGALTDAIRVRDTEAAKRLLASGYAANDMEADGTTALQLAVHQNELGLAASLLQAGASAKATNRYGVGALYHASENGNAEMVRLLLDHDADPNGTLPLGETVLMTAARTGDDATLRALVDAGATVNAREAWKGQTALMWAAAENNAAAVSFLASVGADLDARTDAGDFSAIKFAVRGGAVDATRALIDAGADVEEQLEDGTSLLVLAVTNAHYELANVLLEAGADPNSRAQGWTALHQIAWSRRWNMGFNLPGPSQTGNLDSLDLVRRLVAHGADVNARQTEEPKDGNRNKLNRIGSTAFLLAAKSADLPLMHVLLEQGADPAITTNEGTTALMAAAGVGIWAPGENPGSHEEALAAVRLAYEAGGGKVNDVNQNGETALHGAVYRGGAIPIIDFLVERGAQLDAVNANGWTPVYVADGVEYTPAILKRYPEAAARLRELMAAQNLEVPEYSRPRGLLD